MDYRPRPLCVGAFTAEHLMVAFVYGQFNSISGTIHLDPADITSLSVDLSINTSGVYTGIQKRDDHLRSQEFFDVEKYPLISFKSSKSERTGFSRCRVSGELTIRDITKPISMEVTVSGPVKSPFGDTGIGTTGSTTINREDFGLMWNVPLDNSGFMVAKYVEISMNIEADLTDK